MPTVPPQYLTPDYAAFALGIVIALLGLFTPTAFVGIKMNWSATRSAMAVIIGVLAIAFSYPQLRFWQSDTVNVNDVALEQIKADIWQARRLAKASHDNSSDSATCSQHGGEGMTALDKVLDKLDA